MGEDGGINLYAYVGNNSINATDSLGLLVDATYDKSNGKLTVTDRDSHVSKTIDVVSGGRPFGDPIPNGGYDILQQQRNPAEFRLDKQDSTPYDDVDDDTGRDHFRLHKPGRTIGCIAATNQDSWNDVYDLINNTSTTTVPDNFKPWWKFWGTPQPIKKYGDLIVK